jgi:hypothetical protein
MTIPAPAFLAAAPGRSRKTDPPSQKHSEREDQDGQRNDAARRLCCRGWLPVRVPPGPFGLPDEDDGKGGQQDGDQRGGDPHTAAGAR